MRPVETVRQALENAGRDTVGRNDHDFMAQCPAHDDGRPSLHVTEGADGRALLKCFADCAPAEICAELGLEWDALFDRPIERQEPARPSRPEAEYIYTDAAGDPVLKVVRFPDKRFRQMRYAAGKWEWGLDGIEPPLFRLPEVLRAKELGRWIFVCEGEKDALAVVKAGECGTTMPMGAGKWSPQHSAALDGAKVVILADDDDPGRKHAAQVKTALFGRAAKVGARLPAEGFKDIADHLAAGKSLNGDLRKMPEPADVLAPSSPKHALTAAVFAARKGSDQALQLLGPLFQRGMRTVVGAQTGEGKTTFALQAIKAIVEGHSFLGHDAWKPPHGGWRALVVDLEQGEETVKARLRESGLDTSERVDILWEPNGIAIDQREEDRAMVRDVLQEGQYDLVLLDPLYQMHLGSGNDEQVAAETMRIADGWAREFNCALVIPMHARKPSAEGPRRFTKHDIAGVGTWLRNAEFVLGLQMRSAGFSQLYFFKDRIGRGPEINSWWGLSFDREEGGFKRNLAEDKKRVTSEVDALLKRDDGCTREDLENVRGLDELALERTLRRKTVHELNGRYRLKPWVEQETLLGDDDATATMDPG